MRSTPDQDQKLRARLKEAVDLFAGGSVDNFARQIGYANGGYIREVFGQKGKPVREALIARVHANPDTAGWFDAILSPVTAADLKARGGSLLEPLRENDSPVGGGLSDTFAYRTTHELGGPVGSVVITKMDVKASMGAGVDQPEHEVAVSEMVVDEQWLRRVCTFSSPNNLALINGEGDSMMPTFSDGDALLVDRGVNDIRVDAVYCLALNQALYVKRLQRRPDGSLLMISDNPTYPPYPISGGDKKRLAVLGRVVMAWNARRL